MYYTQEPKPKGLYLFSEKKFTHFLDLLTLSTSCLQEELFKIVKTYISSNYCSQREMILKQLVNPGVRHKTSS